MSTSPLLKTLTTNSTASFDRQKDNSPHSFGFIMFMVMASLCALLGAIYAYIYYTRINPKSSRAQRFIEESSSDGEDGEIDTTYSHLSRFK